MAAWRGRPWAGGLQRQRQLRQEPRTRMRSLASGTSQQCLDPLGAPVWGAVRGEGMHGIGGRPRDETGQGVGHVGCAPVNLVKPGERSRVATLCIDSSQPCLGPSGPPAPHMRPLPSRSPSSPPRTKSPIPAPSAKWLSICTSTAQEATPSARSAPAIPLLTEDMPPAAPPSI